MIKENICQWGEFYVEIKIQNAFSFEGFSIEADFASFSVGCELKRSISFCKKGNA